MLLQRSREGVEATGDFVDSWQTLGGDENGCRKKRIEEHIKLGD
jgi:hypothetical protein